MIKKLAPYTYDPNFDVETIPRAQSYHHERESLIDPHGNRVITIFETGRKGVAILHTNTEDYKNLQCYIDDQQLFVLSVPEPYPYGDVIVNRPELLEEATIITKYLLKNFDCIANNKTFPVQEEIKQHQDMGRILGYPQKYIDYFCKKVFGNKIYNLRNNQSNSNEVEVSNNRLT